jgi:hypothetical protein
MSKIRYLAIVFSFLVMQSIVADEKLNLVEFKTHLLEYQALCDNEKDFKTALKGFVGLIGKLEKSDQSVEYEIGLEFSILKTALLSGDRIFATKVLDYLNSLPNSKFIHMEKNFKDSNLYVMEFWEYGYTQPDLFFKFLHFTDYAKLSPDEKFKIIREKAIKYSNLTRGRLDGSASTTTYGDQYVELIFFDITIPNNKKYIFLNEFSNVLQGSARGNAYLSLAIISEKEGKIEKAKEYSKKCVKILEPIMNERLYNGTLLDKCNNILSK